jgi:hypothetical protein
MDERARAQRAADLAAAQRATDMSLAQRVVAQNNLSNHQSSLSAHSQAAAIRNQWATNRTPAPSYPRPMTGAQQNQFILSAQADQKGLSTGAKVAAAGLALVAIISLVLLIPTKASKANRVRGQ